MRYLLGALVLFEVWAGVGGNIAEGGPGEGVDVDGPGAVRDQVLDGAGLKAGLGVAAPIPDPTPIRSGGRAVIGVLLVLSMLCGDEATADVVEDVTMVAVGELEAGAGWGGGVGAGSACTPLARS